MGVSTLCIMIALAIHGASGQAPVKPRLTITSASAFDDSANDVTLTCVTDTTGVTYSMTRDGTALAAVDGFTAATGILIIGTFATATDTGIYKCKATIGGDTSEESEPLKVAVQNAPADPTLVFETPEKFVIGEDVKLTCTSAGSAEFEWYRGANRVTPHETGATLTLTSYDATANDGNYKCRGLTATPAVYSIYSKVLTLAPVECKLKAHCNTDPTKPQCDTTKNKCVECVNQVDCNPIANKAEFQCSTATDNTANTCVDPCVTKSCKAEAGYAKCRAVVGDCVCAAGKFELVDAGTCKDPCDSKKCAEKATEKAESCKARAATCTCFTENFIVDKNGKCVNSKSGSTNLQMSYLMLGLVTLVSAVWSGRVW